MSRCKGVPLESALADDRRSAAAWASLALGAVVYLGPPSAAEHLGADCGHARQGHSASPIGRADASIIRRKRLPGTTLPRRASCSNSLPDESGLKITGLELVPHDLWAAADLPPMPLTDRLALIAVQFDLAFKVADRGQRHRTRAVVRGTPAAAAGGARRRSIAFRPKTGGDGEGRAAGKPGTDSHRQNRGARKPLGPVLKQLADRLGLELKIDQQAIAAAGISLDQRVSVHVENATVDELLRQLLKSTGLTFHRRDRVVEIVPAEK